MKYNEIFQCLKGVGQIDLQNVALIVEGTGYALYPVSCRPGGNDATVIEMLTTGRNINSGSFLSQFTATTERTQEWLVSQVGTDSSRILFVLRETRSSKLYGFMGLAYGDKDGRRIEGDAIVRYGDDFEPGLMRRAFLSLVKWAINSLGIDEVWVRVISDNPAISFYERCGFAALWETKLFESRNSQGVLEALIESDDSGKLMMSNRTLTYMKYAPSK